MTWWFSNGAKAVSLTSHLFSINLKKLSWLSNWIEAYIALVEDW
jgi:hypothetical protein